jgi:hypothetical protein
MERRNKQNKESLYIIRVRIGVSVLPLLSVLLIKVFLVYSCSFVPNPLKPASSGGISSISCGTSSGTNLERGDSCSFQSVQRYLAGILKLQSLHDNQHGITGFLKANIICIIEIFLIVRPEIMHPKVFSDIGHNGLIISQEGIASPLGGCPL